MKKVFNECCDSEIWKDIKGYEGLYQVSSLGRVRNIGNNKHTPYYKGKTKTLYNDRGYLRVHLYKNQKIKTCLVHRLVAEAFLPNPNNYKEVNHKDENPSNNMAKNLEWCDRAYNNNYGTRNKRVSEKLSIPVKRISKTGDVTIFESMHEAAKVTGFSVAHICRMCDGKKRRNGVIWEKAV